MLNINTSKMKVIHFHNNRQIPCTRYRFRISDQDLEIIEKYKYLGIVVNSHLKFKEAIDILSVSPGRGLGSLINKKYNLKLLDYGSYTKLYNSCVTLIMDYASCCWHGITASNTKGIDDVQYQAMRYFLGVNRLTPMLGMEVEMGWLPSGHRRDIDMILYYNRVHRMGEDRLPRQIMRHQIKNNMPWIRKLENILEQEEHDANLVDMMPINLKDFKTKVEEIGTKCGDIWPMTSQTQDIHEMERIPNT